MNPNKNLFEKPNEVTDSIIYKNSKIPIEEKARAAKEDSLERLNDPTTKTIVLDLLEDKGLSVIEAMTEKDLQNEASNNESLNKDYTSWQLLADCQTMQMILDEEDKKKWEKYN